MSTLVKKFSITVLVSVIFGYLLLMQTGCTLSNNEEINDSNAKNKKYNNSYFEITYPNLITLKENDNAILLTHSVSYEHIDPCDFKGEEQPLQTLTDFKVKLELVNNNFEATLKLNESDNFISEYLIGNKLKATPDFINEVSINTLKGYRITYGVEGCGVYTYYFPLDADHTLVAIRSFIAEFNTITANHDKYINLPGVIKPDEDEKIFNEIMASFKLIRVN